MLVEIQDPVEIKEWSNISLLGVTLSKRDQRLARSLKGKGVEIQELRDGVRIETTSWVGVVEFEAFTLRISPKLENIDVLRLVLVAGGIKHLQRNLHATRRYELCLSDASMFDLVALLLADACTILVQQGLLHGYVVEEDNLPIMRGSLRIAEQFRRNYGQVLPLACRYDDYHANVVENQILHTALALCRRYVKHPNVRKQVQHLLDTFAAVSQPLGSNWRNTRAELSYNRLNARYREAHTLAWMLLEGMQVRDLLAIDATRGFAFLLNMNSLFEQFIAVLVRAVLDNDLVTVDGQVTAESHILDVTSGQSYQSLRPDLLVTDQGSSSCLLIIDAKYKRYDGHNLNRNDIYQMFLYAYAFSTSTHLPAALLLYPADSRVSSLTHLHIRNNAGSLYELYALGVSIPHMLDALIKQQVRTDPPFSDLRRKIHELLKVEVV